MNTPSPLIPQGVTPARGKSSFFFKVLMILTVHVVVIGGMLLQGCKDTKDKDTTSNPPDTTTSDTMPPVTNPNSISNNVQTGAGPVTGQPPVINPGQPQGQPPGGVATQPPIAQPPIQQPAPAPVPMPAPVVAPTVPDTGTAKEYVIASGDTLGVIAHRNGIPLKALMEANPGVNPKKLQVGQKIQVPAGAAPTQGGAVATADTGSGDVTVYVVKSGDTLSKIAKANHTSYKKIMALNDLKTTSIKVNQKLKLPAPKTAGAETPAPTVAPVVPQPATVATQPPPPAVGSNQ